MCGPEKTTEPQCLSFRKTDITGPCGVVEELNLIHSCVTSGQECAPNTRSYVFKPTITPPHLPAPPAPSPKTDLGFCSVNAAGSTLQKDQASKWRPESAQGCGTPRCPRVTGKLGSRAQAPRLAPSATASPHHSPRQTRPHAVLRTAQQSTLNHFQAFPKDTEQVPRQASLPRNLRALSSP